MIVEGFGTGYHATPVRANRETTAARILAPVVPAARGSACT